jgi:hypothetical protein
MNSFRPRRTQHSRILLQALEGRVLFDAQPVVSGLVAIQTGSNAVPSAAVIAGLNIHAQTAQPFTAVIATFHNLPLVPAAYTLKGSIDWGDGAVSPATFVRQPDGTTDVLGTHTYASAGEDTISVQILAYPPPGTLAAVRLVGSVRTKAEVFNPSGGLTLIQTAGVAFTANLGSFHTTASVSKATAIINWGDGTVSQGTIVAVPTAGPVAGGYFVVMGSHTYSSIGSYVTQITVLAVDDTALASNVATTAPKPLALIDSVIDVLPPLPTLL